MIVFAATQAHMDANPGWGKLAALVLAALLFWGCKSAFERSQKLDSEAHSPASKGVPLDGVKPQVTDTADTILTPRGRAISVADDDLGSFVAEHSERLPTKEIVRQATTRFRASKSTVMRRLREARERRDGVLSEDDES